MTTRSKSNRFNPGGRATRLKHVLEQVLETDSLSPLYVSVLQHFGNDENRFNVIDFFLCDIALFKSLTRVVATAESPSEAGPAKAAPGAGARSAPGGFSRARRVAAKASGTSRSARGLRWARSWWSGRQKK